MSQLPNPDVYLNHLPPEQATQFEVTRDLCLVVLGATLWDILVYIPDDFKILSQRRPFHLVTGCFVASRLFSLLFVLLSVVEQTHTVANCGAMATALGVMIVLATSTTAFMFLQRLRAVYADHRWVKAIFSLLWVATSGVMTLVVFSEKSVHIPGTGYCTFSHVKQSMSAVDFMFGFFDTAVFVAISYKLASSHTNSDAGISWATLISGRALPQLSRSILQGGQQYYLITTCLNLPVGILVAIPHIPPIYKLRTISLPLVPLVASMACRVFRNLRINDMKTKTADHSVLSNLCFITPPLPTQPSFLHSGEVWQGGSILVSRARTASTFPSAFSSSTIRQIGQNSPPQDKSGGRSSFERSPSDHKIYP